MSTDWDVLSARGGRAAHDLVGWFMWDPAAIARFESLGVPNGRIWVVAWRLAALGQLRPSVAAAMTYSINPEIIAGVMSAYRSATDEDAILRVRDESVVAGLAEVCPGLGEELAPLADELWRGVDSVHHGARPFFNAHRSLPRPGGDEPILSAWLASNCFRELRGDNHWALCAAADLDEVEVGLLHSVMVDIDEYGDEEWIARSRGFDDEAIARGWARLEAKGFADGQRLSVEGRRFRIELEERTDALTAPAWETVGEAIVVAYCEAIEAHHDAIVAHIDATAGPRWMPASRTPR